MTRSALPDLRGQDIEFLLSVQFAGRWFRFATAAVDILDADGVLYSFDGQLPGTVFEEDLTLFSGEAEINGLEVDVYFPVDVAELVEQGHDLAGQWAEYALWVRGTTWEGRYPVLIGRTIEPIYGSRNETVTLSVEAENVDRGVWPPRTAVISATTYADHDPAVAGRSYPWPFGSPGVYTEADGSTGLTAGSPAYLVDTVNKYVLVAYSAVEATSVTIIDGTAEVSEVFTVLYGVDDANQRVSYVDVSGGAAVLGTVGNELFCRFDQGGGGGVRLRPGGEQQDGAGSLLLYLLRRSTLRIDAGQISAMVAELDGLAVAGSIDEPVAPWTWITEHLLPLLPVTVAAGQGGIELIMWRYYADSNSIVEHLEEGRNCRRVDRISYERDDIANEITLDFAPRVRQGGEFRRSRTVSGRQLIDKEVASGVTRSDMWRNALAVASVDSLRDEEAGDDGIRALNLKSRVVWSTASADWVLLWRIARHAFALRNLRVEGSLELGRLSRGSVVGYTDAGLYMTDLLSVVVGRGLSSSDTAALSLIFIPYPRRDLIAL